MKRLMSKLVKSLSGGDLRSTGNSNAVAVKIKSQADFDELFECLHDPDRLVVMRAADCIEKITLKHPEYLARHKRAILKLSRTAINKELVWHLAQLIPRLNLKGKDSKAAWNVLHHWLTDKSCSRIVRVNALEGLFKISNGTKKEFINLMERMEQEKIPSLKARIKKIRKAMAIDPGNLK